MTAPTTGDCETVDGNQQQLQAEFNLTCSSLQESGKRYAGSLGIAAVLVCVALLVTLGPPQGGQVVTVPIIQLNLSRWVAAKVLVVLVGAAVYRAIVLLMLQKFLATKVHSLCRAMGMKDLRWIAAYPSMWTYHNTILPDLTTASKLVAYVPTTIILFGLLVLPTFLLWQIGRHGGYTTGWFVAAGLSLILFVMTMIVIYSTVGEDKLSKTIAKVESPGKSPR